MDESTDGRAVNDLMVADGRQRFSEQSVSEEQALKLAPLFFLKNDIGFSEMPVSETGCGTARIQYLGDHRDVQRAKLSGSSTWDTCPADT
jgi:hypothetical protein